MDRLQGLPPIVGRTTRLMVFGSFPGVASLGAQQYYAHPQNQLWPILAALLAPLLTDDLLAMTYAKRIATVKALGIGFWDAYAACERTGSLDSAIRKPQPNDYASLKRRAPHLRCICLNGGTAAKAAPALRALGYEAVCLPSTSPAHASRSFVQKLAAWKVPFDGHLEVIAGLRAGDPLRPKPIAK
jgi:hypoxanthine-DNA glycosylase